MDKESPFNVHLAAL